MTRVNRSSLFLVALAAIVGLSAPSPAQSQETYNPVTDAQDMAAAYGRITGPGGQLQNPAYMAALNAELPAAYVSQLLGQAAEPNRLAATPAVAVPGWNVGNPLRAGWNGKRGRERAVRYTNRFGALIRATLYAPLANARDPYTGARLRAPYPGVIITPGSVGGSAGMYQWLAEDLAERGYLVMLFDVQGEGTSQTFPSAFPFCNPFAPKQGSTGLGTQQMTGCPGVPFQQLANFTTGTVDAINFFVSTPGHPYRNPGAGSTPVNHSNPWAMLWDRTPLKHPTAPGRTAKLAIIGHSMGAIAISHVQAYDRRVSVAVALDKLVAGMSSPGFAAGQGSVTPKVPSLALQSEYGFSVTPWQLSGGSSISPRPGTPDPMRERATGFNGWKAAHIDSMLVVPTHSTHLEYTDIPLVLPASRYGQDLASAMVQAWLNRYLKGMTDPQLLLSPTFRYLEPVGDGIWKMVTLNRTALLSKRYCSAYAFGHGTARRASDDWTHVGCS